jgi:hypothetical protein
MSAQIKIAGYMNVATGGMSRHELAMMDWEDDGETVESLITMTDHLAAMAAASAYDEDKERALFEAVEISEGSDIAKDQDGDYMNQVVGQCWGSWKACAKARAKAGGE